MKSPQDHTGSTAHAGSGVPVVASERPILFHVRRHDEVVHVAIGYSDEKGMNYIPEQDTNGKVHRISGVAQLACGRYAKLNEYSRNRIVDAAPTCLVCVVEGYSND